jgi:GDP-L-fucose synthase
MNFDLSDKKVWVAGHRGMVGGAVVRRLAVEPCRVVTASRDTLDLRDQRAVFAWLEAERPDLAIIAAARVGGIHANDSYPAEFLYDNLVIEANVIEGARRAGVAKLVFLGSSCIYPKLASQPIREDALLTGPLEPTNEWYAIAKIAGIKLGQAYRRQYGMDCVSAMPTNLYGPGDNYHLANSHVIPALLRKAHEAKLAGDAQLVVWGSGSPFREFLHVDDLADAVVFLACNFSQDELVNVGSGSEVTIRELAEIVCRVVEFDGKLMWDASKPDGTPRKLMDAPKLTALGWSPKIFLAEGLEQTYRWFLQHHAAVRGIPA